MTSQPDPTAAAADIKPSPQLLDQLLQQGKLSTQQHEGVPTTQKWRPAATAAMTSEQSHYAGKLKKLRRAIKDTIFVNGAVCDEVLRTEEKLSKAKEERRFLLRKLLQYQPELSALAPRQDTVKQAKGTDAAGQEAGGKPGKGVKRKQPGAAAPVGLPASVTPVLSTLPKPADGKKKGNDSLENLTVRPKKGKKADRKVIPPLMLDSLGRPVFPMVLGDVTLHSIGEIVPERASFHCVESIYPAGYCITRLYASVHKVNKADSKCLYTCKISDNEDGGEPLFEIAAEDSSDTVYSGSSPNECHTQLIQAINTSRGDILPTEGRGLDFFALSHPVIQNLIQSCPGSRKCSRYKWVKFDINKAETNDNVAVGTGDPTVGYGAFKMHLIAMGQGKPQPAPTISSSSQPLSDPSTNLRSLLTKGHNPAAS